MKLSQNESRQRVYDAMLKSNGDRAAAAALLGISIRTFYRYIDVLDMKSTIEAMGWNKQPGPVKGSSRGLDIVRIQVLEYMQARGGMKTGELIKGLVMEIFAADDRPGRVRVQAALEQLRKAGKIELDESTGVWSVVA